MKIKRWINGGAFTAGDRLNITTTERLLKELGAILDKNELYGSEVFGPVVFEGADGKKYSVFIEASIEEVDDYYIDNVTGGQIEDEEQADA